MAELYPVVLRYCPIKRQLHMPDFMQGHVPTDLLTDFEKEAMNCFIVNIIKGFFFHLANNNWKKIQE